MLWQVFTVEQALMFEYQGTNYLMRVSGVLVVDDKGEQKAEARGQLVTSTAFVFETTAGSGIKVCQCDRL